MAMEIFQLIGTVFQAPAGIPDPSTLHKNVSGGKPNSEDFSGAGRIGPRNCGTRVSKTDISAPSDFKHVAHVGFNAHDGWDSCFLSDYAGNSDLQLIFTKAGIREEHLRDRRTSIKIFEIIERSGGMQAVRKQASRMGSRGPSPRPVREPFASKVPHQPIVPLLPPLKLLSSMSSAPPAPPPLPPSFTNKGALNLGLAPPAPPLSPPFTNRAALNLGLVPPAPPLSPPFTNSASLNLDLAPPAPPLPPSFTNSAALHLGPVPPAPPLPPSFTNSAALNLGPIPPAPPLPPSFTVVCAEDDAVPAAPPVSLLSNECAVADQALVPPAPPLLPFFNKSVSITPVPTPEPELTFICAENDWSLAPTVPPVLTNTTSLLSDSASVTPASCYPLESRPAIPPAPSLPSTFNNTTSAAGTLDLPPSCNLSTSPSILPACSPSIADRSDTLPTNPSTEALAQSLMRRSRSSRTILVKPSRNKMLPSNQSTGKKLASMEPTSLMDQIRKGIQLKSAKDTPVSTPIPAAESEDLVKALMEVIRKRDRAIRIASNIKHQSAPGLPKITDNNYQHGIGIQEGT